MSTDSTDSNSDIAGRIEKLVAKISTSPGSPDATFVEDLERIVARMDLDPDLLAAEPSAARAYHQLIETVARHHQLPN